MSVFIHGFWDDGALTVWAEGAENEAWRQIMERMIEPWVAKVSFEPRKYKLQLPSKKGKLVPSRVFGDTVPVPDGFTAADVSAYRLGRETAFVFLSVCLQGRQLVPGIVLGSDMLFWADLFRFAGALTARGFFLPGLDEVSKETYAAQWVAAPDCVDRQRLDELFDKVPGVAMVNFPKGWSRDDLYAVLSGMTDGIVRTSSETFLSRIHAARGKSYSAHDAWIAALRSDDPVLRWDLGELRALADELRRWRAPVETAANSEIRLTFKLIEPADLKKDSWTIESGWIDEKGKVQTFTDLPDDIKRTALTVLGQATLFFPQLARAKLNTIFTVTPHEAHAFARLSAHVLRAAGYQVNLPEGLDKSGLALMAEASLKTEKPDVGLDAPVNVQWQLTLGGEPVERAELEEMVEAGTPFVYYHKRWVEIDVPHVREALLKIGRAPTEMKTLTDALRYSIGAGKGIADLPVERFVATGWLETFIDRLRGGVSLAKLPSPEGMKGTLRPYQERGYAWLSFLRQWGFGACLADDMGLGKTIQTLALILRERKLRTSGVHKPVLLAAPLSVLSNWMREMERFTPELKVLVHHGPQRAKEADFLRHAAKYDVILTSYNLLYLDYATLRRIKWLGIVLDEAQNIKNPATRQSRAARALDAEYRVALTGTPVENHVGDLWSIMDFLNPGLLGTRTEFRDAFFNPIQFNGDATARERLARVTGPFLLRRLKSDKSIISDLPKKEENRVFCMLTKEQTQLYNEITNEFKNAVRTEKGASRKGLILAVLTKLKQICNHPMNYLGEEGNLAGRSGKLSRLEDMLSECFDSGDSSLVFTQYAEMGRLLQQRLCEVLGEDVPFLHGGLTEKARSKMVKEFQDGKGPGVFVLSLKAGGTGLNLTRANRVFHFDRWWNPAVEAQATDRVFRIGQTKNVMVHSFICSGTLEERIDSILQSKQKLADQVVKGGESALFNMSNAELQEVLELSAGLLES